MVVEDIRGFGDVHMSANKFFSYLTYAVSILGCLAGCCTREIIVTDYDTGIPIEGALVSIHSSEFLVLGKRQEICKTNLEGKVWTRNSGLASIRCGKIGYWPAFAWLNNKGATLKLRLQDAKSHSLKEYRDLYLSPTWLMFSSSSIPYKEQFFPETLEYSHWLYNRHFYNDYPKEHVDILMKLFKKYKNLKQSINRYGF